MSDSTPQESQDDFFMVMSHLSDGNGLWANDNYQIKCMSAWVKKEMYFQGIRIHTDVVFDIGFFFKSE